MAVAVQANLVQLKVAQSKRAGLASEAHEIQVSSPGAVTDYRETLIPREVIAGYDDTAVLLRVHEVWGSSVSCAGIFTLMIRSTRRTSNNCPSVRPYTAPRRN